MKVSEKIINRLISEGYISEDEREHCKFRRLYYGYWQKANGGMVVVCGSKGWCHR